MLEIKLRRGESVRTLVSSTTSAVAFNADLATALVRTGLSHDLSDQESSNRLTSYGATADFVLPGLCWE